MAKREKKLSPSRYAQESVDGGAQLAQSNGGTSDSRIRERAYELYLERGDGLGDDVTDWLQAEREVQHSGDSRERAG